MDKILKGESLGDEKDEQKVRTWDTEK